MSPAKAHVRQAKVLNAAYLAQPLSSAAADLTDHSVLDAFEIRRGG